MHQISPTSSADGFRCKAPVIAGPERLAQVTTTDSVSMVAVASGVFQIRSGVPFEN